MRAERWWREGAGWAVSEREGGLPGASRAMNGASNGRRAGGWDF